LSAKRYLLTYPDGSRRHINRETRDSLLLSQSARETAPGRYLYIGEVHTYKTFSQLREISFAPTGSLRSFLAGHFIFELKGKRNRELIETPEGMALRMAKT
jgi:hypothetical protein